MSKIGENIQCSTGRSVCDSVYDSVCYSIDDSVDPSVKKLIFNFIKMNVRVSTSYSLHVFVKKGLENINE